MYFSAPDCWREIRLFREDAAQPARLILQQTSRLGSPTVWSNTTDLVSINGLTNVIQQTMGTNNAGQISVTHPATVGRKFFRLKSQ